MAFNLAEGSKRQMGRWADKTFDFVGGEIILPVKGAETNPATVFRPWAVSDDPFTPLSPENSQSRLEIQALLPFVGQPLDGAAEADRAESENWAPVRICKGFGKRFWLS